MLFGAPVSPAINSNPGMHFKFGSSNIPHVSKRHRGGEDAWLANDDLLVVADGVGGWARHGIDSGEYSRQLVQNIFEESNKGEPLHEALMQAVNLSDKLGSSTAVIARIQDCTL